MLTKVFYAPETIKQKFIYATTYSRRIRETVDDINKYLNKEFSKLHLFFEGHPCGIKNEVYSKPVEMCIMYRCITSDNPDLRLLALEFLQLSAFYHESLEMVMNTRRVQMFLIKEIVKAKGNYDLQCRLVSMFYEAQSGRAPVIRRLLNALGMIEVPEPDINKEQDYNFKKYYTAWDDQIYSGMKNDSQLLYEFHSKGGSKATIVYDSYKDMSVIVEALAAAELLDIDVTLGIERLVQDDLHPELLPYYMVIIFENCKTAADYALLLKDPAVQKLQRYLTHNSYTINGENCLSFSKLSLLLDSIFVKGNEKQPLSPKLVLTRPLRNGLRPVLKFIIENYKFLDAVEIWNNQAFEQYGDVYKQETISLNQFREWLNSGNILEIEQLLKDNNLLIPIEQLKPIIAHYAKDPQLARINGCANYKKSDKSSDAMGKGFILTNSIRNSKQVAQKNKTEVLPFYIEDEQELHNPLGVNKVRTTSQVGNVLPVGRAGSGSRYDDSHHTYWMDLNLDLKDFYRVSSAFLAVYAINLVFPGFSYGPVILGFWFCITYGRNFIVDMLAKAFAWIHFDRHNAADSIFYSYFSVPILKTFDHFLALYVLGGDNKDLNKMIRFFTLALVNGAYIVTHNTYRGFNKKTKIANFFRTIFAFPLAVSITYALDAAGLEYSEYAVLINKCASDTVGGIVEGIPKRYAAVKRTQLVMNELIAKVFKNNFQRIDVLDLLRVWKRFPKGKAVARKILLSKSITMEQFNNMLNFPKYRLKYKLYITKEKWVHKEKLVSAFTEMIEKYDSWIKRVYVLRKIKTSVFYVNTMKIINDFIYFVMNAKFPERK